MKKILIVILVILVIVAFYFSTKDPAQNKEVTKIQNNSEQLNKKYLDFTYTDPNTKKEDKVTISVDGSLLGKKTINQITPPQSGVQQDVYIGGDMGQATYNSEKHAWSGFYKTYKTKSGLVVHTVGQGDGGYSGDSYLIEIPDKNIWLSIIGGYDGTTVYDLGKTDDPEYKEYLQIEPLIESIQITN